MCTHLCMYVCTYIITYTYYMWYIHTYIWYMYYTHTWHTSGTSGTCMYDGTCTISYRLVLSRIIYKMNNQQNLKIIFIIQYTKARYTFVYVLYIYYIEDEQPTKSQNNFYHTIYHTKARYTFVYYVCDIKMCVYRVHVFPHFPHPHVCEFALLYHGLWRCPPDRLYVVCKSAITALCQVW